MNSDNRRAKEKNILSPQQMKRASWEFSEEEQHPIFTEEQLDIFEHVDNYDDALAVLDEKNEIKNKLRSKENNGR